MSMTVTRKSAAFLWGYFFPKITVATPTRDDQGVFMGYTSDQTGSNGDGNNADHEDGEDNPTSSTNIKEVPGSTGWLIGHSAGVAQVQEISPFGTAERKHHSTAIEAMVPQLKQRKHEMPICFQHQGYKNGLYCDRLNSLLKIKKKLNTKQSPFKGGHNRLQACCTHIIHRYLHMLT